MERCLLERVWECRCSAGLVKRLKRRSCVARFPPPCACAVLTCAGPCKITRRPSPTALDRSAAPPHPSENSDESRSDERPLTFSRLSVFVDERLGRTGRCAIGSIPRLRRGFVRRLFVAARRPARAVSGGALVPNGERRVKAGVAQTVNFTHSPTSLIQSWVARRVAASLAL